MRAERFVAVAAGVVWLVAGHAAGQGFVNGDFATGSSSGWAVANMFNGVGAPGSIATIDIDGPGPLGESTAAAFRVGVVITMGPPGSGIEMTQVLHLTGGAHLTFDFDWSAQRTLTLTNLEGGTFSLIVNGTALATQSAGPLTNLTPRYGHVSAGYDVPSTGDYTVGVRIVRPGTPASDVFQYVDNVTVSGGASPCYANCDGSTLPPVLNVNDFSCFLNLYAAGSTAANCDGSTSEPVLNVNDFTCFLNRYAAGCG